jgi:hypothetical protein
LYQGTASAVPVGMNLLGFKATIELTFGDNSVND